MNRLTHPSPPYPDVLLLLSLLTNRSIPDLPPLVKNKTFVIGTRGVLRITLDGPRGLSCVGWVLCTHADPKHLQNGNRSSSVDRPGAA